MKKIVFITLLLFTICGTCFADNRWQQINQSNDLSIYIDSFRASSYGTKKDPYLDCWLKWVDSNGIHIDHTLIRSNNGNYMIKEIIFYDNDGKVIGNYSDELKGWINPIPGSVMEYTVYNALAWGKNKGY